MRCREPSPVARSWTHSTGPWKISVWIFSECLRQRCLNVDGQREGGGEGTDGLWVASSSPTQSERCLVATPTSFFIFLLRFWHDQRYLWDGLLPKRREGPAAGPLDVSRVAKRWRVHNDVWCLVWEHITPLHTHTPAILHYTCINLP